MSKLLPENFTILKNGEAVRAGEVSMRNTLHGIVPFTGDSREAWFYRIAQTTGIPKRRVRSLFYKRNCRVWAEEWARIQSAQRQKTEKLKIQQGELQNEAIDQLRQLLSEALAVVRDSGSSQH